MQTTSNYGFRKEEPTDLYNMHTDMGYNFDIVDLKLKEVETATEKIPNMQSQLSNLNVPTPGDGIDSEWNVRTDNTTLEIVSDTIRIRDGGVSDDKIGNRTLDDSANPPSDTGTLGAILNWIARMIKGVTGESTWRTIPSVSLKSHVDNTTTPHGSTYASSPNKIIIRDNSGRAQVSDPAVASDIANKGYVDVVNTSLTSHVNNTNPHGAVSSATASTLVIRDNNGRAQVSNPSTGSDIANKDYVDALFQGVPSKTNARVATTANIVLSGTQTIDGVTLVSDDKVLVKDQSTSSQNGLYLVKSDSWIRATDADISAEFNSGIFIFVQEGSVNSDTGWQLTTNSPITLGSTALTFTQVSGLGQIVDGDALLKTGNRLDVRVDDLGIEISGDKLQLKVNGTTDSKIGDRTITDTIVPTVDANNLTTLLSNVGFMLKSITGKSAWRTTPSVSLETTKTHIDSTTSIHGAVSTSTPSKLIIRDSSGRAQVANPSTANDIANKAYVDTRATSTQNGLRNITMSTSDPSGGVDGDVWIKYIV